MSDFVRGFPQNFGGFFNQEQFERTLRIKEIRKRLKPIAKKLIQKGEKYKVIARPHQRRATLDTTINLSIRLKMEVTVRAIDENGAPLEIDRIWTTKNGKNKDIRRTSKGKGEPGDKGPYVVPYKPSSTGISKFKVQTVGNKPSIIYYSVKQVG